MKNVIICWILIAILFKLLSVEDVCPKNITVVTREWRCLPNGPRKESCRKCADKAITKECNRCVFP